jgi:hypothetical protein
MKLSLFLFAAAVFISCKKNTEGPLRLLRKEATTYTGVVLKTEYEYDSQNRIIAIKQAENNATLSTAVTISYSGNEAVLISHPTWDPSSNITKEVRLTLDGSGKLLKKIGYSYMVPTSGPSSRRFIYDTLECEYDAAGFLQYCNSGLYDSTWSEPGYTSVDRSISRNTFTTSTGNLIKKDLYVLWNRVVTNSSGTTTSGGTSESHSVFSYARLFPNKADFTNAAILNETLDFSGVMNYYGWVGYFETLLAAQYQNMPERVVNHSTDRDLTGSIIFDYTSTYANERTYNADGLLSVVDITTPGTPYTQLRYFYGR